MSDHFKIFINNLTAEVFKENLHLLSCEDFNNALHQSITICEQNSNKIHQGGSEEDYWFMVLEELYAINYTLREKFIESKKELFTEFMENISDNIRNLLEKMCSYVSIQAILNVKFLLIFKHYFQLLN